MDKFNFSYCKLDQAANIIEFDQNFRKLFNITKDSKLSFRSNFNISPRFLEEIIVGDTKSFILFYNSKVNNSTENNALAVFYIVVEKHDDNYKLRLVNWLNWIHCIGGSLESSYSLIMKFNDSTKHRAFKNVSDAGCFKALYPLLTYLPNKSSNGVTSISLFEIMRVFVKLRNKTFTRDYARNVYSRIRTSIKMEYGHNYSDVISLIKNNELVQINFGGEIMIPNTILAKNIIIPVSHDKFLLSIIDYTI